MPHTEADPVVCPRCDAALDYVGTKKFHEGSRGWGFWLGDLGELFVNREHFDVYVCPRGKILQTTGKVHDGRTRLYRASKADCDPCPLKPRCCPNTPSRKIPRDVHEDARDVARSLADTPAFARSRNERKKVEMLFAHLKRILRLGRLRLRDPVAHRTSFCLPPPSRTSESSPSSERNCRQSCCQHDRNSLRSTKTAAVINRQRA